MRTLCVRPVALMLIFYGITAGFSAPVSAADPRSYMHGIEAVPAVDGGYLVFFSSAGLPPRGPDADANWTHDIYQSSWNTIDPAIEAPNIFIQNPEAQEPVSVAKAQDGHIMLTLEDGWNTPNGVNQRYGVYDAHLHPVAPYPLDVAAGGHSGHVAAVGNRFVVVYSNGWIKGGGVENLGSGYGVYAKIYDSKGRVEQSVPIAKRKREWWPLIAGSDSHALLAWQQYVPHQTHATLKVTLLDAATGTLTTPKIVQTKLQYYTYQTAYVPAIGRFLVTGTHVDGKGFASLIGKDGQIPAELPCMPAVVREAGIAVVNTMAYTPSQDGRLLHLALTPQSITLQAVQPSPLSWGLTGSLGLPRDVDNLHWISLAQDGVKEADFNLKEGKEPTASDHCR